EERAKQSRARDRRHGAAGCPRPGFVRGCELGAPGEPPRRNRPALGAGRLGVARTGAQFDRYSLTCKMWSAGRKHLPRGVVMPKTGNTSESKVVATLHREQANALVAYLNYKKYHWLTYGPPFRDVHLLLAEQAPPTYETIDELAGRGIMIGGTQIGDPADYLGTATVKPSTGKLSMRQMIAEARESLDVIIREMHQDTEVATTAGDIGTADLYTRLVQ